MINIGGFGHSGNTALVDFFADSPSICPIGYDFTESALIRSKWGIKGVVDNFNSEELTIKWNFIEDCLLGVRKPEHEAETPPVHHDFTRNARVCGYLGSDYRDLVKKFVCSVEICHTKDCADLNSLHVMVQNFLKEVSLLSIKKSGSLDAIPLTRNDPAAANIDLLRYSLCSRHYTMIRDPGDMMYDWISYYNHSNDNTGARLFSRQFGKKIDDFLQRFENLPSNVREKVVVIKFEDLVLDKSVRLKLYEDNRLTVPNNSVRFDPDKSKDNIGISANLSAEAFAVLNEICLPKFNDFIRRIPIENLVKKI